MPKSAALIIVITLFICGHAIAGPLEEASQAYARGDFGVAHHLFRPLAKEGIPAAQFNLAVMYDLGLGVPQDYTEAFKWYRRAADQGYADAQNNLGVMYECGLGVPKDSIQAYKWFSLASSRFPSPEQEKQEVAASQRDRVASGMTPAQIAEAQRLEGEWKPKKER